jgi:hypothetical protein
LKKHTGKAKTLHKLDDETKRKMFNEYGATLSKTSIFLSKLNVILFMPSNDKTEAQLSDSFSLTNLTKVL